MKSITSQWVFHFLAIGSAVAQQSPPVFPSPPSSGIGWEAAFAKAQSFVAQLSIDQKANLVTGTTGPCVGNVAPFSNVSSFRGLCLEDGPLGIRQATNVSTFPAGVVVAAAWDRTLARQRGALIGAEFKGKGAHIALGPVCGPLGKNALGGRNWEGFSVDPYLTGLMSEETINGLQSAGVQATIKHFIGNEQETQRTNTFPYEAMSSNIDDATIHELYMWPFANAVRAGVASVMCSYNRINDTYACQNSKALNGLLKEELGFQGYVVSDWLAQHSGVDSANAGLDVAMPGGELAIAPDPSYWRDNLATAVKNGSVAESRLNDMAYRFLTPYFFLGQDSSSYPYVDPTNAQGSLFLPNPTVANSLEGGSSNRDVQADHANFIRQLGAAGTVLLKNDGNILPLKAPRSIGVFANDAPAKTGDIQQTINYYSGALPVGGGSGTGNLPYVINPLSALEAQAAVDGTVISSFTDNYALASGLFGPGTFLGLSVSSAPDVCVVFLKTWASEGSDRSTLDSDWSGDAVVTQVAAKCPNTIVVTHSAGINTMPWASLPNVKAILAAHYPGQEMGSAIVDVLYGRVNPSGHLPYTIALSASDYNTAPVTSPPYEDNFSERLLIDYKYFDAANKQVQYPFGHGLSYTSFSISSLAASVPSTISSTPAPAATVPGGNPNLWATVASVSCTVTNTGDVAGAAVPQLYISLGSNAPAGHPVRQLRGFDNVFLQPGQSQTVQFELMRRDVSYWDVVAQQWTVPAGQMTAWVGWSSRDLQSSVEFTLI